MARPRLARITCPGCRRWPVAVGRASQRIYPHKNPQTNELCANSGQEFDLYGAEGIADADVSRR